MAYVQYAMLHVSWPMYSMLCFTSHGKLSDCQPRHIENKAFETKAIATYKKREQNPLLSLQIKFNDKYFTSIKFIQLGLCPCAIYVRQQSSFHQQIRYSRLKPNIRHLRCRGVNQP